MYKERGYLLICLLLCPCPALLASLTRSFGYLDHSLTISQASEIQVQIKVQGDSRRLVKTMRLWMLVATVRWFLVAFTLWEIR